MKNDLAVITVVYNNYVVTEEFLKSLKKQRDKDFRVYISDLSDEEKEIRTVFDFTVLKKPNKGYGFGLNCGLKQAIEDGCDKFVLINNDTEVKEDFIEQIKKSSKDCADKIIGAKIYYYPGFEYHKNRYEKKQKGKVLWYAGGIFDWDNIITVHRGVDQPDSGQYDRYEETEFITGCFMLFDKSVLNNVGFFDTRYFMYWEDADYCIRAKKAGIKLIYDPSVVVWHKNAQSTEGSGSKFHVRVQRESRLRFGLKYAPIKTKLHLLKNLLLQR